MHSSQDSEDLADCLPGPPGVPGLTYPGLTGEARDDAIHGDNVDDRDLCDGLTIRQVLREYIATLPLDSLRDLQLETAWKEHVWPYFTRRSAASLLGRNIVSWSLNLAESRDDSGTSHIAFDLLRNTYEWLVLSRRLSSSPFWEFDEWERRCNEEFARTHGL